ncbi:MAG: diacylglycerol kinase family protein [Myxococcota bacterium]|jgi:diacylglycerol kinase family enzyme|nr:diacylglycerol kinase family protein [Myxococcota bacterium]
MPGIGVISNRNARLNKLNPKLKDRMAFMLGRGGELASTGSLDDAHKAVEAFKRFEIDMVAISGGDGTAHRTIEVLIEVYGDTPLPPVLLLPTGTQNMVPKSFGIRDSGVATLVLTLARYRHNVPLRTIRRNMLKVNEHYSFMFSVGVAPRFLKEYYDRGQTTPVGAAKLLASLAYDAVRGGTMTAEMAAKFSFEQQVDHGPWSRMAGSAIFCSFIEELALGFKVFPRAGWDPNVFETVIGTGPATRFATALPHFWTGSTRRIDDFDRYLARTVEFRLDKPECYTLDGEVYEPLDRFVVSAGPEIDFVVPGVKLRGGDPRVRWGQTGPWDMRYFV